VIVDLSLRAYYLEMWLLEASFLLMISDILGMILKEVLEWRYSAQKNIVLIA